MENEILTDFSLDRFQVTLRHDCFPLPDHHLRVEVASNTNLNLFSRVYSKECRDDSVILGLNVLQLAKQGPSSSDTFDSVTQFCCPILQYLSLDVVTIH